MRMVVIATFCLLFTAIIGTAVDAQQRVPPPVKRTPPGPDSLVAKMPDLVPVPSRILNGAVSIRNAGTGAAGPSVATVVCKKIVGRGSCAESPALKKYTDPAYPNALVVEVPALQPKQVHSHLLPFWKSLKWQPGTYQFTVTADAGKHVSESNEGNNVGVATMKK